MKELIQAVKILVVDDEEELRKAISRYLTFLPEFQHTQVLHASSFDEAWQVVENEHPLILLQDINLPDGHGLQLIQQVKKVHPMIQCIIITAGVGNLDRVVEALTCGAVDYVKKPLDMERLRVVVGEAVTRCERWWELFHEEYRANERK